MMRPANLHATWRILASLLLGLASGSAALHAQQDLKFDHLTVKNGLSQGTVICILQDRHGFMWFGTQDGLNRYDGYTVTVFRHEPGDSSSLDYNFVVMLAEDTTGTLWVGTLNSTAVLNRYDPLTETFTQYPADSANLHGARINAARAMFEDRAGVWWYGLRDGGLKRVDPHTGKTTILKHNPSDPNSIASDDVFQVVEDHAGMLWVSTSGGLDKFDPRSGVFTHFRHDPNNPRSLGDDETWPLLIDRQGDLWVGSYRGGLNRFNHATETFIRYTHNASDPRSIAGDRLYALYQDQSGLIWVGTGDQGVDRVHPELAVFNHYMSLPGTPNTLSDGNIQSLHVDQHGIIWIGTRNGLNRWDRVTGKFTHYKNEKSNPYSISDNIAQSLFMDRSGALWVGTASSGLDRLDPSTGRFRHYRHDASDPRSLSDDLVYALYEDRGGDLWVGTYAGGLNRLGSNTTGFQTYRHHPSDTTSLGSDGVFALLEDNDGVLWVGTYGGGLNRFNRQTGTFTRFRYNQADSTSLSDDIVICLCEDRAGHIWVGTTAGLNLLNRRTGTFDRFTEADGLANNFVFGILEDNRGHLWISTNKGISDFNPKERRFDNYDYNDGLQGNEFNQGAYARDQKSGEILFGGPNGFNIFDPTKVRRNPFVPPVVLSLFTRYNTDDKEGRPIEERGISARPAITVSYKDNITSFEFAALNYYNNFKNRYTYQLEGFSDNWIQLGTDRQATFTNLDGGEYVLHIRGSNNDGVWNEKGTSLNITVTPPWWKTRWAYGSYAVLFIAFLYGSRKFELDRQKQKARIREAELHTKAVEAENRVLEVQNERQTKELEDARRLQLSMLPKDVPKHPEYDIAVFMKTATEVGGDYYDFSVTPDGQLNVAFGDATGHGMQAGTIVTLMKGLFLSEASRVDIQTFFNHCSRAIKDIRLGRLYMALTLARFAGKTVSLSSAGMPPAYLFRKHDGTIEEILLKAVPLGSMKNFPYSLHETSMEEGDTLLLLTDGLPEQKNSVEEMFDYARVIDSFKTVADDAPEEIITHLVREGETWMTGAVQDDDITLMVIRKRTSAT